MAINYVKGDLLEVKSGIIVHGVNCQGVMASGIAKQIREKYPATYDSYMKRFSYHNDWQEKQSLLGYCDIVNIGDDLQIVNAFTQFMYGRDQGRKYVSYDAIHDVFNQLYFRSESSHRTLHFPKIGSGLGGGSWSVIEHIIQDRLGELESYCYIL